jgi:hypothetical protein
MLTRGCGGGALRVQMMSSSIIDKAKWERGCVCVVLRCGAPCGAVRCPVAPYCMRNEALVAVCSIIQSICSVFVLSWFGVVKFRGVRPTIKGQSPGGGGDVTMR